MTFLWVPALEFGLVPMTRVARLRTVDASSDALRRVLTEYVKFERAQATRRRLTNNMPVPTLLGWTAARVTGLMTLHTLLVTVILLVTVVVTAWAREVRARLRLTRLLTAEVTVLTRLSDADW
jgi:hypothetical protein